MSAQAWVVGAVCCAATVDDLARRRISNWIPLGALVSGLAIQSAQTGWRGTLSAVAGASVGGAVFLLFYALGGLGGGDIKLMAGLGAVLGTSGILEAALWTAALGGVLAVAAIAFGAVRRHWNNNWIAAAGADTKTAGTVETIPYAPAIALGAWLALLSHVPGAQGPR